MNKENLYYSNERKINEHYFDGNVTIREVYNETNSRDQEVYFVEFDKGSLTTIHLHETEQFLIPMYGNGIVGEIIVASITNLFNFKPDDLTLKTLNVGEIVSIPSNILHFHGALPGQNFSHIAFRKMFEPQYRSLKNHSGRTQTKWGYEIIAEELDLKDPLIISKKLKEVSEKIRDAISEFLK